MKRQGKVRSPKFQNCLETEFKDIKVDDMLDKEFKGLNKYFDGDSWFYT